MAGTVMNHVLSSKFYQKTEELFMDGIWHREIQGLGLDFRGKTVLDLAAGTGHWEEVFLSLGAKKIFWQDLSEYFYEIAKHRLQDHNHVEFILGDMTSIPLGNESVDFVMCRDSLYHSPDEKGTMAEIYRVLKKDGHFYLTARNWRRIFREPINWKSPLKLLAPHIHRITGQKFMPTVFLLEGLTQTRLQQCGFKIDKISREDSTFFILACK